MYTLIPLQEKEDPSGYEDDDEDNERYESHRHYHLATLLLHLSSRPSLQTVRCNRPP